MVSRPDRPAATGSEDFIVRLALKLPEATPVTLELLLISGIIGNMLALPVALAKLDPAVAVLIANPSSAERTGPQNQNRQT